MTAKVSKNFDFAAMGVLSANIPSSIANVPVPLIGGKSLSLNGLISFKANYSLADDYVAVWLQYNVSGPFGTSKHVVGVKATFELQFSLINAIPAGAPRSALTLDGDPAISAIPQPLEMSPTAGSLSPPIRKRSFCPRAGPIRFRGSRPIWSVLTERRSCHPSSQPLAST